MATTTESTPSVPQQRYSPAEREAFLTGEYPHDEYVPRPKDLSDRICDAIDPITKQHFDPINYQPPEAWKLLTHSIGGNSRHESRFELAAWEHPLYGVVAVASRPGANRYIGAFDGTVIHVGSRYITYLRTCLAIDERTAPPTIHPSRWRSHIDRWGRGFVETKKIKRWLDTYIGQYPQESLLRAFESMKSALTMSYTQEKELTKYIKEHATTTNELYANYQYGGGNR